MCWCTPNRRTPFCGSPDCHPPAQTKCTWEGCEANAAHEQKAGDGAVWANLCVAHNKEMDAAIDTMKPPVLMKAWIKAQGGSKAAAQRMVGAKS